MQKYQIKVNSRRKNKAADPPIRIMQSDTASVIEAQFLYEDNSARDLTDCTVTFSAIKPSGGKIIGEKATVIDAKNGLFTLQVSTKITKKTGKFKSAYFSVHQPDGSIESTRDVEIVILPSVIQEVD